MKKLLILFVSLLLNFSIMNVNGQDICSSADTLKNINSVQNYNIQSSEYWLTFYADSIYFGIILNPLLDSNTTIFTKINIYTGSCDSLIFVDSMRLSMNNILATHLQIGSKYYIQIIQNSPINSYLPLLCLNTRFQISPLPACNPNSCSLNANGDFENISTDLDAALTYFSVPHYPYEINYANDMNYYNGILCLSCFESYYNPTYGDLNYTGCCNWFSFGSTMPFIKRENNDIIHHNHLVLYHGGISTAGSGIFTKLTGNSSIGGGIGLLPNTSYQLDFEYKINENGTNGWQGNYGFNVYLIKESDYVPCLSVTSGYCWPTTTDGIYIGDISNTGQIGWQPKTIQLPASFLNSITNINSYNTIAFEIKYGSPTVTDKMAYIDNVSLKLSPTQILIDGTIDDKCHRHGIFSINSPIPGITYNWSFAPTNVTINSNSNTSIDINFTDYTFNGNFIISVDGIDPNTGCTMYHGTKTINFNSLPASTVTQVTINGNIDDCMQGLFTITPHYTTVNYTWTLPQSAYIETGYSLPFYEAEINWSYGGAGTIEVNGIDSHGCLYYGQLPITPTFNCVPNAKFYIKDGSFASTFTNSIFGGLGTTSGTPFYTNSTDVVYFEGIVLIDQNLYIDNCPNIIMSPNAKLYIYPGVTLSITNSYIKGCSCYWDGISSPTASLVYPNLTSHLILDSDVIQDAKAVVQSEYGGNFNITNTTFVNNQIGIKVSSNYFYPNPGYITANTFKYDAVNNQGYFSGNNHLTGINLENNTEVLTIGDNTDPLLQNNFVGLQYGIKSDYSDAVEVYNNNFTNIAISSPNPPSYSGIPSLPDEAAIFSINKLDNPAPHNIIIGGSSNYSTNTFNGCNVGIFGYDTYMDIENNNFIKQNFVSIHSKDCIRGSIISNNTIAMTPGVPISSTQGATSVMFELQTSSILTNDLLITNNSIDNARIGILMSNASGNNTITPALCKIDANTIQLDIYNYTNTGIFNTNGDNVTITNNTITYSPHKIWNAAGIYLADIHRSLIQQNYINDLYYGIIVKDHAEYTEYSCNQLLDCDYGFYFSGATLFNNLPYSTDASDNQWTYQNLPQILNNRMYGTTINTPLPRWNHQWLTNNTGPLGPYLDMSNLTSNYITSYPNRPPNPNCISDKSIAATNQNATILTDYYVHLRKIIKDSITYSTLSVENKYMAKEFVYNMLDDKPSLLNMGTANDQIFQNFHNSNLNTNIGKFSKIKKFIKTKNYTAAKALNTTITPQNLIETNSKEVNRIYLNRIAVDSIIYSSDSLILYNIAMQSPLTGGNAVYNARAILDISVTDNFQTNNNTFLLPLVKPQVSNYSNIKIYPNPANDKLFIQLDDTMNGMAIIEINDLTGKLIYNTSINADFKLQTIDISKVSKGIYYLRISNNKSSNNQKLVIIK